MKLIDRGFDTILIINGVTHNLDHLSPKQVIELVSKENNLPLEITTFDEYYETNK